MLHRFSTLVAACTLLLIAAGGMVTSTESGLSVPDWPSSYGYFMFSFPLSYMVGGIFYEHGHRLIASTVGLLMIVLAAWLWLKEPRRWLARMGMIALGAVIVQGLLGGITVLWFLPAPVSIAHAGLAQIFFCMTVSIALFTSPSWLKGYPTTSGHLLMARGAPPPRAEDRRLERRLSAPGVTDQLLRRIALMTTGLIYLQIIIGATMRHTGAGLAIPDFPWAFGHLLPPVWSPAIAIHFTHRLGALVVLCAIAATTGHVFYHHRDRRELLRPAIILVLLVIVQITLGALTILSAKAPVINTAHVATGALVLVTSLVLTLRAHRVRFGMAGSAVRTPASRHALVQPDTSVGARA